MEDRAEILAEGRRVLRLEAAAIGALEDRLGDAFLSACRLLTETSGRVVASGIGKSGIVARKIAATLTSTGTPSIFVHPVEGLHGDLGIVSSADVALLVSKSGETSELEGLIEYLIRLGVPIIALTGKRDSALGRHAQAVLDCSVAEEACPLDLAPTSSTTAALAMGDALAMVVFKMKGFQPAQIALIHPRGALGRKLTLRVEDAMVAVGYPVLAVGALVRESVVPIAEMRGTVPVVDEAGRLVGVLTAGDLTRLIERDDDWAKQPVAEVMNRSPRTARVGELGSAAVRRMEQGPGGVMALPVVDESGILKGVVHLHDLLRAGAV